MLTHRRGQRTHNAVPGAFDPAFIMHTYVQAENDALNAAALLPDGSTVADLAAVLLWSPLSGLN